MKTKIKLVYKIIFESPFHIGSGKGAGLVDSIVLRNSEKQLFVPGSAIKGVFRNNIEKVLNISLKSMKPIFNELFGIESKEGDLFFDSAFMSKEIQDKLDLQDNQTLLTEVRSGTEINREMGIVSDKSLFQTEYGMFLQDTPFEFEGEISGYVDDPEKTIILLYIGVRLTNRIGGSKSVAGDCNIQIEKLEIDGVNRDIATYVGHDNLLKYIGGNRQ